MAPAADATAMLQGSQEYFETVSHPNSYAGYIEIAAADELYNISINVVVAGTAVFPPVPNLPLNKNTLLVIYHLRAMHYSTFARHPTQNSAGTFYAGFKTYSCLGRLLCKFFLG